MSTHKISLPAAILVNLNIMMGAGIFINTTQLAQLTGALGGLCYLLVGILSLPLIVSVAQMVNIHPEGGFYTFGQKEISPFTGFISAWSYFTGKLASATLMIHASMLLLQQLAPALAQTNTLILDLCALSVFTVLNMLNVKTGSKIQYVFMVLKLIPVFFAIGVGLFLFNGMHLETPHLLWSGIPFALPFVLYAATGFEATCSLSSKIENAKVNGPRAIFISYTIAIVLACIYQTLFYLSLGTTLAGAGTYLGAFPALVKMLLPFSAQMAKTLYNLMHIFIASSALGGAYGILYSNNWNLYTLAQNGHTFGAKLLTKLNKHYIPFMCVLVEGLICALYFSVTSGYQKPLQQISALGCVLAYTITVIALLIAKLNRPNINIKLWIPILGIVNCAILIASCLQGLITFGPTALFAFGGLLSVGAVMFFVTKK